MWKAAAVMCALFVASVAAALTAYEHWLRIQFSPQFENWQMQIINQPLIYYREIDGFFGRNKHEAEHGMFKPNEAFVTAYIKGTDVTLKTVAHSNNLGFLSDHPYAVARDPQRPEYRIAVFGDSMTGVITATRQWTDYLEKILNASASLRALVNGREFRVYNFGAPGQGFPHFWKMYEEKARQFDPDMLVVNYIELDFPRTEPVNEKYYLSEPEEQIGQAVDFFKRFMEAQPNVLFTLAPLLEDLTNPQYSRTETVLKKPPSARHRVMRDLMLTFGGAASKAEYRDWYNWPKAEDGHMSDKGNDIYARAMACTLGQYLSEHVAHKPFDKGHVADEVAQTQPDVQLEDGRGMRAIGNKAYIANLRQTIIERTIAARRPLIRSAVWDKLPNRPSNPFQRDQFAPIAALASFPSDTARAKWMSRC